VIKQVRLFFLLWFFGFLSLPGNGQVVHRDTAAISLEEVTITASRIPENAREFSRITRIISSREIESSPARDLAGLLEYIPDIDVRQRGPAGVQSDISLRGGTFDQFAILINGINFNDPQTGHFQLDIPVPLSMIQRIEVLPGSDVKSLGSNAYTGAINIVTGVPAAKSVHAGLSGGQYGYLHAGIDARNRSLKWWQQSGIEFRKSSGYRFNTDFNNLNGFFQTGYSHNRLNFSLLAGGLKKAFGANSFYSAKYPGQFEKTGSIFSAVQAAWSGRINIRQSLFYRQHTDEFSLFRSDPPAWYLSPNYHLSEAIGSKSDAWFTTILGKTAFGFEFRYESIWSTVLGEISKIPRIIHGIEGVEYTRFGSRNHFILSAEQQIVTGPVKWNGGVVLHDVQSVKNYLQVYPGLDVSYTVTRSLRTFLSLNRAFRLPTFTELYYKSPTNQGNAALLPESAWHAETGAEYQLNRFTARLIGFYRYASQSIDWVRQDNETIWHTENLGRIITSGIESGFSYSPVKIKGLLKFADHFDLGFRYYFQHHTVESYHSQYVLDYLKWKLTAGLTLKIARPVYFTANWVWQERNGTYTSTDGDQNMTEVDYKPFMVMDFRLSCKFRQIVLFAGCTNLFDTEYFDLGSVPQPGAWYQAGIEINLVGKAE